MADRPAAAAAQPVILFGPFRLLPAQQQLLEGENPVRLGSRALEILVALVERAGEVVGKNELIARVWPNTVIDENTLRVHVAGLRRALGDGQPGRRYLASVPGRGYRFVAPVSLSEPERLPALQTEVSAPTHNLPLSKSRLVGRARAIDALRDHLLRQRFVTIVGAGGIGKTAVALALAETLLPVYEDGVRFVDLASVDNPQFVPSALGARLGLAIDPEHAVPRLVDFLKNKSMLIVLDSCEHATETAAFLAERLLAEAAGIHILATSREPLRAAGERVHRLLPLDVPADSSGLTAVEALTFPAIQLFVERAATILDGFELCDGDAPIVSDICRKLGGIALAIELAAARVDAFGIHQLATLLDDQFRILKQGKRTAQPRHRSLTAALDWSYEFLPEVERIVLCRLSVFAGVFTLASAIAVAGNDNLDVVEAVANLVAKSLISADIGGAVVHYRLLDTTRAYALQKLTDRGEFEEYARRHAQHHLDWFERAEADWQTRTTAEWLGDYGRIDDVRAALTWAFSPIGDPSVGVSLTVASIPLWLELSLLQECRERIERALQSLSTRPTLSERDELKLRVGLGLVLPHATPSLPESDDLWVKTLALAEKQNDLGAQGQILYQWSAYCFYVGDFRKGLAVAEKCCSVAAEANDALIGMMGRGMVGLALYYLGDHATALRHIEPIIVEQDAGPDQRAQFAHRTTARATFSEILWIQGFPDQAVRNARNVLDNVRAGHNPLMISNLVARVVCPIMLYVGDWAEGEQQVEMLLELSAKSTLNTWNALSRCLQGTLLLAQGDFAGLPILRNALNSLREARFALRYAVSLGALALGLASAGQPAEARAAIEDALERADSNGEAWCLPELLRIKGEILRSGGAADANEKAEDCFRQALDLARRQQALSWELRAAMSLAGLWRDAGKIAEAKDLLSGVYDRFAEGFDTVDLRTARALIEAFA